MGESSPESRPVYTIGDLAHRTGVSVRTIRHYSDVGVLPPAGRTASGYRLYGDEHVVRLEAIRSLRSIDFDLPTIGQFLHQRVTLAAVAELQLHAVRLRLRSLQIQEVILQRAVHAGGSATVAMLDRWLALVRLDRSERQRFLDEHLEGVLGGASGDDTVARRWWRTICNTLPEELSERQVNAWLDLADLVADDDFMCRVENQARPSGAQRSVAVGGGLCERTKAVFAHAAAEVRAGRLPTTVRARGIAQEFIAVQALQMDQAADASFAKWLLSHLEETYDVRVDRFWHLMATLRGSDSTHHDAAGYQWLVEALRSFCSDREG